MVFICNVNAQLKIDKNIIDQSIKANGFDISKLSQIKAARKLGNFKLGIWVLGQCGLLEKDFPSREKMNEIKNTITLNFALFYSNQLMGAFSIAKFKSYDDSKLAWADSAPISPPFLDTLISGEKIEGAKIKTSTKTGCVVWIYLFYKNWLCETRFSTGGRQLNNEEKNIADNTVKIIKKIIDEIEN